MSHVQLLKGFVTFRFWLDGFGIKLLERLVTGLFWLGSVATDLMDCVELLTGFVTVSFWLRSVSPQTPWTI